MSKLTREQCCRIGDALDAFEALFSRRVGYNPPTSGAELSDYTVNALLDRLNRLAVAVTSAIPDRRDAPKEAQ